MIREGLVNFVFVHPSFHNTTISILYAHTVQSGSSGATCVKLTNENRKLCVIRIVLNHEQRLRIMSKLESITADFN